MTQRTLIERLREYEKALEAIEGGGGVQGEVATAALTDLSELIKEAEGQGVPARVDGCLPEDYISDGKGNYTLGAFLTVACPLPEGQTLYTALGEKP